MATEQPALLWTLPAALVLSLHLAAVLLALFVWSTQSWLPSRQEQEVIDALEGRHAAPLDLQDQDYVEWEMSRCYGYCPVYRVSLSRRGEVQFEGRSYTCQAGEFRRQIPEQQAASVLAAAAAALRHPVGDSDVIDASRVTVTARVAGQSHRLELSGLDYSTAQVPLRRLLDDGGRIVLDPGWLPVWSFSGATCLGAHGERISFDPRPQPNR